MCIKHATFDFMERTAHSHKSIEILDRFKKEEDTDRCCIDKTKQIIIIIIKDK